MEAQRLVTLDLDETLVYATEYPSTQAPDFMVENFSVYQRPFLEEFLLEVAKDYTLAIWSAGSKDYVQAMARKITPPTVAFTFIWGRDRCTYKRDLQFDVYYYLKSLKKVKRKGFSIEDILIVENTPQKVQQNYGNAIYVKDYLGQQPDDELYWLWRYLRQIKDTPNFRSLEKRGWKSQIQP